MFINLNLLFAFLTLSTVLVKCENICIEDGEYCIYWSNYSVTSLQEAQTFCSRNNSNLLELTDDNFMNLIGKRFNESNFPKDGVWLNLKRMQLDPLRWVDGTEYKSLDYLPDQPFKISKTCATVVKYPNGSISLNAKDCSLLNSFACQKRHGDFSEKSLKSNMSNWFEARDECLKVGMDLIVLKNNDVVSKLKELMTNEAPVEIWIGLIGQMFYWQRENIPLRISHWFSPEPIQSNDCAYIPYNTKYNDTYLPNNTEFKWLSTPCESGASHSIVCLRAPPLKTTTPSPIPTSIPTPSNALQIGLGVGLSLLFILLIISIILIILYVCRKKIHNNNSPQSTTTTTTTNGIIYSTAIREQSGNRNTMMQQTDALNYVHIVDFNNAQSLGSFNDENRAIENVYSYDNSDNKDNDNNDENHVYHTISTTDLI